LAIVLWCLELLGGKKGKRAFIFTGIAEERKGTFEGKKRGERGDVWLLQYAGRDQENGPRV